MSAQNSSSSGSGINVHPASLQQQKWDLPCLVPAKPAGLDYGYFKNGQWIKKGKLLEYGGRGIIRIGLDHCIRGAAHATLTTRR